MSHSTVLVVIREASNAQDAEGELGWLLEPFNENAEVAPYFEAVDIDRAMAWYREHPELLAEHGLSVDSVPESDLEAFTEFQRKVAGIYASEDPERGAIGPNGEIGYMCTYNPDSRWDWWTLGGRWHGYWQLKERVSAGARRRTLPPIGERVDGTEGLPEVDQHTEAILGPSGVFGDEEGENFTGRADLARKGDIDFEAMRTQAGLAADATYDAFERATAGIEPAPRFTEVRDRVLREAGLDPDSPADNAEGFKQAVDRARAEYGDHPWVKAINEAHLDRWFDDPRDVYCVDTGGRAKFVARARAEATSTFALLMDGTWYESGHMGWWGVVSDEKDPDDWAAEQAALIDSLPDDTYLAVVDVHI